MELDQRLQHVSVIGAGGKMGRGIASLILLEMIRIKKHQGDHFKLILIDHNPESLNPLRSFLKDQVLKYAEKNINQLRELYKDWPSLISNLEIIQQYVEDILKIIQFDTSLHHTEHSKLIFEAVAEDIEIKVQTLESIAKFTSKETLFFTNTSSIPIALLDKKAHLKGRLAGFHFYNPPMVQKVVELVFTENASEEIQKTAFGLAERLKKTSVIARDVAGFIGNGYFIRELHFACLIVHELEHTHTTAEAIWMVNFITQDLLLRPMGIFQLMDFVGLDVCQAISQVMGNYLPDLDPNDFKNPLLEKMITHGHLGGQFPEGGQKPGFFEYKEHHPIGIYDATTESYRKLEDDWIYQQKKWLHVESLELLSWKTLSHDSSKSEKIQSYLSKICDSKELFSQLSLNFLLNLEKIGKTLLETKVIGSTHDLDTVLMNGFYHLYSIRDLNFIKKGASS